MKKQILFTVLAITIGLFQAQAQVVVVDNCDAVRGWTGGTNVMSVDNKDKIEGAGAIKSEGEHVYRFRKMFANPVATGTNGQSGYLSFSLFVENASAMAVKPGFVVISSAAKAEENAHRWSFKNIELKNGWNNVVLEMSPSSATGGDFDGNLKYFAVVQTTSEPLVFKLDNIRFAKKLEDLK